MGESSFGAALVANIVARAHHGSSTPDGKKAVVWLEEATEETSILIRSTLDATDVPLSDLDEELWRLVWSWRWLNEDEMRAWLRESVGNKPGWSLDDVLARLVSPGRMDGRSQPPVDFTELEVLLGVDYAIGALDPEAAPDNEPSYKLEPTWENRRRLGRSLLAAERQRRATSATDSVDSVRKRGTATA